MEYVIVLMALVVIFVKLFLISRKRPQRHRDIPGNGRQKERRKSTVSFFDSSKLWQYSRSAPEQEKEDTTDPPTTPKTTTTRRTTTTTRRTTPTTTARRTTPTTTTIPTTTTSTTTLPTTTTTTTTTTSTSTTTVVHVKSIKEHLTTTNVPTTTYFVNTIPARSTTNIPVKVNFIPAPISVDSKVTETEEYFSIEENNDIGRSSRRVRYRINNTASCHYVCVGKTKY
ncbi:hypothetical protein FSP39_011134 [Pinctada imbricata]|uniref:Uncharacterized protein n=1 Tax=Pinctada imbricata TaxID=66713 RepID=A0AA89BPB8_PINIB|nr:hypothetical protein FSP39_011134 [Pinctada imbricata]